MTTRLLALVAVGFLALGACVANPLTQKRDVVFVSQEEELRIGQEASKQVAAEMGIVDDAAVTALVDEVGGRVASAAPEQGYAYTFHVVDLAEPNAFALPGGHIYVSRGLMALTNDEDALANVLAHEIVHVSARHHAQRQARATGVGILAFPGLLAGGLVGLVGGPLGSLVSAPFALAGVGAIASYSRGQELEADEYGQRIAAQAGYDPTALADVLRALEADEKLRSEDAREPSWLDSHPSPPRRVAAAEARKAPAAAAPGARRSRQAYLKRLDGLLVGENPAEGVFEGQRFLHPDMRFSIVFPDGWKTANTRRAVGAFLEDGQAQIVLELDRGGANAREAANAFLAELGEKTRVDVARVDTLEIAGSQAVRANLLVRASRGPVALDATWIEYGDAVFRLSGIVPRGYDETYRRLFGEVGGSFSPLSGAERSGIREARLRLGQAQSGESLTQLSQRAGNHWSPEETAVVNGLAVDELLAAGRWMKVAVEQPYSP